ncbi:MAG TPA: serine hydrolase, partial [Acidobacteriota bacterium]|nr:serine hydrolase [Acidobacteriota bacterium]
ASEGTVGVSVKHMGSGEGFSVNGDASFPLASVVKLPILTEVMAEIKDGRFGLSDEWSLKPSDQFYDGSLLSDLKAPGIRISVENLINMMMWLSDNTATDLLLTKVGIDRVNARMRSFGIDGILVGRTIRELLLDYYVGDSPKFLSMPKDEFARLYERMAAEDPGALVKARADFGRNPADHATPQAVNALLEKIFRKEVLDPASCDHILKVMADCQTGAKRIRGLLPPDTAVAHKTGTIGGTINDCGIIELPGGAGHVALSVLSKDTDPDPTEDTIALIAKTVYDYFLFAARAE